MQFLISAGLPRCHQPNHPRATGAAAIIRTYVAAATNWPAWRCSCDVSPALAIETSISGRLRRSATLIILQGNHSSTFPPVRSRPYGLLGSSPADGGRGGGDDIRVGHLVAAAT